MAKKIYEVRGTITIDVFKRVKANNAEEAMELAERHFGGLTTYGCHSEQIGVEGEGESLQEYGDDPEWVEAYESEDDDYDTETDTGCTLRCNLCGEEFYFENEDEFDYNAEDEVWDHLGNDHEDICCLCEDWDTSAVIDEYFEREDD